MLFLAAIALSKTLDYYADAETSDMSSSPVVSTNEENKDDNDTSDRNLYDKAGKPKSIPGRRGASGTNADADEDTNIVSANIKTIVVICSKSILLFSFPSNRIF